MDESHINPTETSEKSKEKRAYHLAAVKKWQLQNRQSWLEARKRYRRLAEAKRRAGK